MEKRGLIERRKIGRTLVLNIPVPILNSLSAPTPIPTYRIHDLWLTLQLKDQIQADTTTLLASSGITLRSGLKLKNHTDSYFIWDGYEARLNPSSLEIHLPDLDNLPLEADLTSSVLSMFTKLETTIAKLEARLGVKAIRLDRDTLIARITQLHIALRDHKFAETINEKGEKLYVYVDSELRVIVDHSHGLHEYEAISRKYAIDDADKLGKLTKGTITGQFDYEKDHALIHALIENNIKSEERMQKTEAQLLQLAEQLNIHAPYLTAWKDVAEAISIPSKRGRALRAIADLRQSKLMS